MAYYNNWNVQKHNSDQKTAETIRELLQKANQTIQFQHHRISRACKIFNPNKFQSKNSTTSKGTPQKSFQIQKIRKNVCKTLEICLHITLAGKQFFVW